MASSLAQTRANRRRGRCTTARNRDSRTASCDGDSVATSKSRGALRILGLTYGPVRRAYACIGECGGDIDERVGPRQRRAGYCSVVGSRSRCCGCGAREFKTGVCASRRPRKTSCALCPRRAASDIIGGVSRADRVASAANIGMA
jgi:hypothetical protein